jgi:serine/threonine protein kinase/DNA-binding transcriptional regulator YhcF (GntR family)
MAKRLESLLNQKDSELKSPSQLVSHFILGIATGSISKGDTFPLPIDFAASYKIEPTIVVKAVRIMEDREIVRLTNQYMIINADPSQATKWLEDDSQSNAAPATPGVFQPDGEIPVLDDLVKRDRDRYTKKHMIAEGGMGTIYAAYDNKLNRNIAIKVIKSGSFSNDSTKPVNGNVTGSPIKDLAFRRFIREAQITSQLDHPSIVPLYDISVEADGSVQYSMKLIKGETLSHAFEKAKTLEDRLLLISHFLDVCNAVAYAHEQNVLHRDLKPSNIMLGDYGETIVIDWGLAKVSTESDSNVIDATALFRSSGSSAPDDFTQTDEMMGTRGYIAPELFGDGTSSKQTDIYSLGAILFSLISGKEPKGKLEEDAGLYEDGLSLTEIDPTFPLELVSICQKALNPTPEKRYQSALDLSEDIQSYLAGTLVLVHDYTPSEIVKKYLKRYKFYAITLSVTALIVVVILSSSIVQLNDAKDLANQNFYKAKIELASKSLGETNFSKLRESLQPIPEPFRGLSWNYLNSQATMYHTSFEGHTKAVQNVFIASDGTVITSADDSTIRFSDPETGIAFNTLEFGAEKISHTAFDGAKNQLLISTAAGTIHLYDVNSRRYFFTKKEHATRISKSLFHPVDNMIISASYDRSVHFLNGNDGSELRAPLAFESRVINIALSTTGTYLAIGLEEGETHLYNLLNNEELGILDGTNATFSHDEHWLTTYKKNDLYLYDLQDRIHAGAMQFSEDLISATAFGQKTGELYVGDEGGNLIHWNVDKKVKIDSYNVGDWIRNITPSREDSLLAVSTQSGYIHVFERDPNFTGYLLNSKFLGHEGAVKRVKFHPRDEHFLISASSDATAKMWDVRSGTANRQIQLHDAAGTRLAISPDQSLIASIGLDESFALLSTDDMKIIYREEFDTAEAFDATTIEFSPNNRLLAFCVDSKGIKIMNVETGVIHDLKPGYNERVGDLHFSEDGARLYWTTYSGQFVQWDMKKGELISSTDKGPSTNFVIDAHRNALILGQNDGSIHIYDLATLEIRFNLKGHREKIKDLIIIKDGILISASDDRTIKSWDLDTRSEMDTLTGHTNIVQTLAYSPEFDRLISSGWDEVTKVWNWKTREDLLTLESGLGVVRDLAVGENVLFMLGDDGILKRISFQ